MARRTNRAEQSTTPSTPTTVAPPSAWLEVTLGILVVTIFLTLSISSLRRENATFDEGSHIPAAYTYAARGDFRLNPEHPPLTKLLAGMPMRLAGARMDDADPTWKQARQWDFGALFLYHWNDADRMVLRARIPMLLLALMLLFGVWACARELYGWQAGWMAALLAAFSPDVLAHGHLVTTDLAVACFLFLAVYLFYRALRGLTVGRGLLVGVAMGLALLAKFSGVLILPMVILVGLAFVFSGEAVPVSLPRIGVRTLTTWRAKLAAAGGLIVAASLLALLVVWAGYLFRYRIGPAEETSGLLDWNRFFSLSGLPASLMQTLRSLYLVPEGYSYGFLYTLDSLQARPAFLLGEESSTGWWYYFIITFLIKTPIPLLVLVALGFYFMRRYGAGRTAELTLLLPVALYWLVTLTATANIGHRHLLPVYPFLFVFASKLARVFAPPRPRMLAIACAVLLGWYVVGTLLVAPHFLTYFNEAAGGPSRGYLRLTDSNLDWGQDLKALAAWRRAHPEEPFYLSYFGTAEPEYYGIKGNFLPGYFPRMGDKEFKRTLTRFDEVPSGATVAISATNLSGIYLTRLRLPGVNEFLTKLRGLQPIAKIGNTIFIYRLP